MKKYSIYKQDQIVVATESQKTSCGIEYIKKGSILKVRTNSEYWQENIGVYRNHRAESNDNWHVISKDKVRPATEKEIQMYNKEIYFITTVKTY